MGQAGKAAGALWLYAGRMKHRPAISLGVAAILALLGVFRALPPFLGFFACAVPIIFFPGLAIGELIGASWLRRQALPERLIIWFVLGIGVSASAGYAGLVFHLHLGSLVLYMIGGYTILALLLALRPAGEPAPTLVPSPPKSSNSKVGVYAAVLAIALGAAILTLVSARDFDDWYYISYMRDYIVGKPLGVGDAIFGMGRPLPPRVWFGGGWWVTVALLARVSGIDPVACQQIYMPLLTAPAGVLALFMLAIRLFGSYRAGLLGCSLQVLHYLAGALPQRSAGWFFFCRLAQDKTVSFFVVAPVVAALAIELIRELTGRKGRTLRDLYRLYLCAVLVAFLIHGMGPVWCGLLVFPFALGEVFSRRDRKSVRTAAIVALPVFACGLVLAVSRSLLTGFIAAPGTEVIHISQAVAAPYLPGGPFFKVVETAHPVVWLLQEHIKILNPLYVTRLPLAIAGLVLTFFLIPKLRSDSAARFLFSVTLVALFLVYVPIGVAAFSRLMSDKLLFRIAWVFPWGLTIAFFLLKLRWRPLITWLIVATIALGLARGNPANLVSPLAKRHSRNRPWPEAVEILNIIGAEPSPQGAVLAPDEISRMIPAFLPDAIPVNFRDEGPIDRENLKKLLTEWRLSRKLFKEIKNNKVRYVVVENGTSVSRTLARKTDGFTPLYKSENYSVFLVKGDEGAVPTN